MRSTLAMRLSRRSLVAAALPLAAGTAASEAEPLTLHWMFSSGAQRTVWVRFVERFARQTGAPMPRSRELEQSAYKAAFESQLPASARPPDLMFWFAGRRLAEVVELGLLEPLDELAAADGWEQQFHPAALDAVRVGGRLYALPLSTYQWGFYYRRSLFRRLSLVPPVSWSEWLLVNDRLRAAGVAPITLGGRDLWPLGAWFDYLNLRLHGKAFHIDLLSGRASWLDRRVAAVFGRWAELLERGDFLPGFAQRDWRQALPYLSRGEAGMVLMGNFVALQLPPAIREDLGFFRFPLLDPRQPLVEEAPLDVLVLPRHARRRAQALEFLRFVARPDQQAELNRTMGMISPHRQTPPDDDPLVRAGTQLLAAATASTQFFDRDAPASFSQPALGLLARFATEPRDAEAVMQALEALRLRVWRGG